MIYLMKFNENFPDDKGNINSDGWELLGSLSTNDLQTGGIKPFFSKLDLNNMIDLNESIFKRLERDIQNIKAPAGFNLKINNEEYSKKSYDDEISKDDYGLCRFHRFYDTFYGFDKPQRKFLCSLTFKRGKYYNRWEGYLEIHQLEDDYFLVSYCMSRWISSSRTYYYKCDQYDGLTNLIKYLIKEEMCGYPMYSDL